MAAGDRHPHLQQQQQQHLSHGGEPARSRLADELPRKLTDLKLNDDDDQAATPGPNDAETTAARNNRSETTTTSHRSHRPPPPPTSGHSRASLGVGIRSKQHCAAAPRAPMLVPTPDQDERAEKPLVEQQPIFHQLDQQLSYATPPPQPPSYQQQQQQRQMVSADFGSYSAAGQRSYALDFANDCAVYPSFASDQAPGPRAAQQDRLVAMEAEFAELTYSSSAGHFLSLDPAVGPQPGAELQLHNGYEQPAGSYASLYPAQAESVIRLGSYHQQHAQQTGASCEHIQLDANCLSGPMLSQSQPMNFNIAQQQQQQLHYAAATSYSHQPAAGALADLDPDPDQGLKVCEWEGCEHTFLDMQEFVKHLEDRHVNQEPKEKGRYFCLWANCKRNEQEFNARYKLLIHMRVHSGEKPYPCNNINCKKSFSRLENLKIHQRSHTGEKPYKCNFDACSKSFTNSSDRIKHHKTHKDPKPYSCNFADCTKRYTDPSSLRKHLRTHKRPQLPAAGQPVPPLQADQSRLLGAGRTPLLTSDFEPTLLFEQPSGSAPSQQQQQHHLPIDSDGQVDAGGYHNQHWQLSRSWCAGSTPSARPSLRPFRDAGSNLLLIAPDPDHDHQQQQQQQLQQHRPTHHLVPRGSTTNQAQLLPSEYANSYQQRQQQLLAHETLMRSMPAQGSRARHAPAGWPPPPAQRAEFRAPYPQQRDHAHSMWSGADGSADDSSHAH